jgi:protein disulfide-isomerase
MGDAAKGLNSFTRYYDFKFGRVDCEAYRTVCDENGASSYPVIILFKDGKEVKKSVGTKSMEELSAWIEEILESIRPGSRPKKGLVLPAEGAHEVAPSKYPLHSDGGAALTKAATVKDTPNPAGESVALTAATFQRLVTAAPRDTWFVKFYAPWCSHCHALQPAWAEMAREMKGKLHVGEVNCDVERLLCKDAGAEAYPTLLLFRGGEKVQYAGLRAVGDLIAHAKSVADHGMSVAEVNAIEFATLEQTEEVIFVYFYDDATTTEDWAAVERLTLTLVGHARLVKTKDADLAKRFKIPGRPRLIVSRDGKAEHYDFNSPKDMRDFRKVLQWMKSVWQPLVPELTVANAKEVLDGGLVVLALLSRERAAEFAAARRELKSAAAEWVEREAHRDRLERQDLRDIKQLRMDEAEDRGDDKALDRVRHTKIKLESRTRVKFAWVDAVYWARWLKSSYGADVASGEKVLIVDQEVCSIPFSGANSC